MALCDGSCDLHTCSNVLDYVEKEGASAPQSPPACASFTPSPVDASGASTSESLTRVTYVGAGPNGLESDWSVLPFSRDP